MNVLWISHAMLTPLATTQLEHSAVDVIMDSKEMEPIAKVGHYLFYFCWNDKVIKFNFNENNP